MHVEKTKAEVRSLEYKKETGGVKDEMPKTAAHVEFTFSVPRETIDAIVPMDNWSHQFWRDGGKSDDTCLDEFAPIKYHRGIEKLNVTLDFGSQEVKFEMSRIMGGMKLRPEPGHFITVECKAKLYPTNQSESGNLDRAVKEFIHIAIEPMNVDVED
jgi:hypothetical protein